MEQYFEIIRKMTVTGFIIFVLGILTLTPEIYIPGLVVMVLSTTSTMSALEIQRVHEQHAAPIEEPIPNQTYYSW